MLKLLIILSFAFASTVVFGQTIYTWVGLAGNGTGTPDGTNIANAANWSPTGGPPSGASQDTGLWNGDVAGNLVVTYNNGLPSTGGGTDGINFALGSSQTGNVQLIPVGGAGGNIGLYDVSNQTADATFTFGDPNDNVNILNFVGRPGGAIHDLLNDSAAPSIINANVRWQAGAGAVYTLQFDGTGNWYVTNSLANANSTGIDIAKQGSGTLYWNGPSVGNAAPNGPINAFTITAGAVVLEWDNALINGVAIEDGGTLLEYNAPGQTQVLNGIISGNPSTLTSGTLEVAGGTLDLKGQNTYDATNILAGGTVIADAPENPGTSGPLGMAVTNSIEFNGGTLEFSVNNIFDYSSRFSSAPGQQYNFNAGGQAVIFTNTAGLTSSGGSLTMGGPGSLTIDGPCTYSGATVINGGTLIFDGGKSGTGAISVADSAALGINASGSAVTPSTLTVGTSSGAALNFYNVASTTTAALQASALAANGPITINIESGTFVAGGSYPLFTWTSGTAPTVNLAVLNGALGNLSMNGDSVVLNITALADEWNGNVNGDWTTADNWLSAGSPATYVDPTPVVFNDSASETAVIVNALVQPKSVTFENNTKTYTVTSSTGDDIGGTATLSMSGTGTTTLSGGANSYTGVTTLSAGLLQVGSLANGGSDSDIGAAANSAANLVFNGGDLQYTGGGATSDHLFSLGTGGGTIDSSGTGALVLNNTGAAGYIGTGARVLTLTGTQTASNVLAAVIADNGGSTEVVKSGASTWVLTGNNTYSGGTTVSEVAGALGGELVVGRGTTGALGSGPVTDDGSLDFDVSGSLTVAAIGGIGSVTNDGPGTVILSGNNTYSGATTINNGVLQVGNGGATGTMLDNSFIFANTNGTFVYDSTGTEDWTAKVITGPGGVIVEKGSFGPYGNGNGTGNTYTGPTTIDSGATFQPCKGNEGQLFSSVITNNGELLLVRQDNGVFVYSNNIVGSGEVAKADNNPNFGDVTLLGTNTYTGGTLIQGGNIILGDGGTPGFGSIVGNVTMSFDGTQVVPAELTFNRPDTYTFSGNITGVGSVMQEGPGTTILTGTNTYNPEPPGGPAYVGIEQAGGETIEAGTYISAGTLQIGNGGASGTLGANNATTNTVLDDGNLVFDLSANYAVNNAISGTGNVVQYGADIVTLTASNSYTGTCTVSNGTLVINGYDSASGVSVVGGTLGGAGTIFGPVTLSAGTTLAPGSSPGAVGTLTISNNLTITSGNVLVAVNKSLSPSPSNSVVFVSGTLANSGTGTLTVTNIGPALAVGDTFQVFNQAVPNGASLTVTGGNATWTNNLAASGSISVKSIIVTTPPTLNLQVSHSSGVTSLQFSWTGSDILQAQTNSLTGTWYNYPGGGVSPVNVTVDPHQGQVYFRLAP